MAKKTINSTIPAATLAQRLAALSETQLMDLASNLAKDAAQDWLCTEVLETLEKRVGNTEAFERFVSEIYA